MFEPSSPVKNLLKQGAPDETRENKVAVVSRVHDGGKFVSFVECFTASPKC